MQGCMRMDPFRSKAGMRRSVCPKISSDNISLKALLSLSVKMEYLVGFICHEVCIYWLKVYIL